MDLSAISSAIAGTNTAIDIARKLFSLKSLGDRVALEAELNIKLNDTQKALAQTLVQLTELAETNLKLKTRVIELEDARRDREQYRLHEVRTGAFVYRLEAPADPLVPLHYLCQPCYDKGFKMVLELRNLHLYGKCLCCHGCNRDIALAA